MRRPVFWAGFTLLSAAATAVGIHYFPQAFSIVRRGRHHDGPRARALSPD